MENDLLGGVRLTVKGKLGVFIFLVVCMDTLHSFLIEVECSLFGNIEMECMENYH